MSDLTGKTILVTGATSGIGLEASVVFAQRGARVVLVGRDAKRMEAAKAEIGKRSGSSNLDSFLCDFSSQKQIRALAEQVRAKYQRLDVLLNNAGLVNKRYELTEDGIESTFAVNHLGYFLLTQLLLDLVVAAAPGARIVNVASIGHRRGTLDFSDLGHQRDYGIMKAYATSKLANVLFTRELAKRLEGKGVTVNCLHPGAVATNIWSKAPLWAQPLLAPLKALLMITPEQGGQTLVYLATSPEVATTTGLYFEKNQPSKPSRLARDDGLAAQLWAESEKLVKGTATSAAAA